MTSGGGAMLRSSAAERNKQPLLEVLQQLLPSTGSLQVLEIASGTGQHVSYFAKHLPHVTFQPSEVDNDSFHSSISAYVKHSNVTNVKPSAVINTTLPVREWANAALVHASYDVIVCINMTHISEWASTEGLFAGCREYLKPEGVLLAYGPYKFDKMLKQQNSEWGLRDMNDLERLANSNGLVLHKVIDLPANNKAAVFRKQ